MMELFAQKRFIIDVEQSSKYASVMKRDARCDAGHA